MTNKVRVHNVESQAIDFHCSVFGNQFMHEGEVTVAKEILSQEFSTYCDMTSDSQNNGSRINRSWHGNDR